MMSPPPIAEILGVSHEVVLALGVTATAFSDSNCWGKLKLS